MKKVYNFSALHAQYTDLLNDRTEWEQEWRQISDYLLPGRGIYQRFSKPRKRKLTSPKVINTIAEDALYILTSGMHGGLTSPSRPWFDLEWQDDRLKEFEPLKAWLQDSSKRLHAALHASNFYSVINSFYTEYAGFGTGSMYVGSDTDSDTAPFRFELLTAGEYVFAVGANGLPIAYFRTIFWTPSQVVEKFPKTADEKLVKAVKAQDASIHRRYITILECVYKEEYGGKPFTQEFYTIATTGNGAELLNLSSDKKPLDVKGFHEFPYPIARWNTIGSDSLGIGPGSRALPDIKRLQEMEKAFLMATHKTINPPLNAPARLRGKLNTLPGGYNYYANPNEQVKEIYRVQFDYNGVGGAVERVEQRIQRNFFNDIFLTGSRDPNASPYKAAEVHARDQEKMLRLGPVIERLQHEFFQPMLERCFNIMLRKDLFQELSPELAKMAGDYQINLISPLATAQRSVALQGINSFMAFIGNAAQFDQSILDNVNPDKAAREYADISGVDLGVLRPQDEVDEIRENRAKIEAQERAKQEAAAMAQTQAGVNVDQANARKTSAEAGLTLIEGQATAAEAGL